MKTMPKLIVFKDNFVIHKFNKSITLNLPNTMLIHENLDCLTVISKYSLDNMQGLIAKSGGWRLLKVDAVLDFLQSGILSAILSPLAKEDISVLVISSFDTDYIFIQEKSIEKAIACLINTGYEFNYE